MDNDSIVISIDDELEDELDPSVLNLGISAAASSVPKPAAASKNSAPMHHRINQDALSTYIYPTNLQVRDYQYNIVSRAFFHNTLVVLPTGLGKTFIASTVILNYTRWFPDSKIVFMAPTRPLVAQQIKACCGITGLPPSSMAILLDLTRRNRASIWDEKKVFFTTPQVVENDLKLGTVSPKSIALLVIDEAHRAKGNYAYNNVVKFMDRFNPHYRILAMTATPASTIEGVQEIIDNLHISKAEVRTEQSIDIIRYLKHKTIERFHAEPSEDIRFAIDCVSTAIAPFLKQANEKRIYDVTDPAKINAFTAMDASRRLLANHSINDGLKWSGRTLLQTIGSAGQCLRRLNIYGIRSFYTYFKDKYAESIAKSSKSGKKSQAAQFLQHPEMTKLIKFCEQKVVQADYLGHEKLEIVVSEVKKFFATTENTDSRVIIFSEFREAALDIVRALDHSDASLKPHIFIGQSKDTKSEETKLSGPKQKTTRKNAKEIAAQTGQSSSELAQLTGMSQKMQKETIKNFKEGMYNILVATSIGEEGLDIGEVDLIVCYDSTSSPIKNIQRMGRTGRNRDGKILLLFSGNEESKFDRAMGGYEYIQQHIMNGELVQLYDQNRLIPNEFTPTVEERLIEIPEENKALKDEADEDEIIKLATKYMTAGKSKAKSKSATKASKSIRGQPKIQKKFFMPDNVETGFQPVSVMVRDPDMDEPEVSSPKRQKVEARREPDLLDLILDSDLEDEILVPQNPKPLSPIETNVETKGTSLTEKTGYAPKFAPAYEKPITINTSTSRNGTPGKTRVSQPQLDSLISSYTPSKSSSPSLGVRKRQLTIVDQLKAQQTASQIKRSSSQDSAGSSANAIVIDGDDDNDNIDDEDDIFDDDDEILALAQRTQSGDWKTQVTTAGSISRMNSVNEPGRIELPPTETMYLSNAEFSDSAPEASPPDLQIIDEVEPNTEPAPQPAPEVCNDTSISEDAVFELTESAGILSSEEWDDLYMNYYVPVDAYELENCANFKIPAESSDARFRGSRSAIYLRTLHAMESMTEEGARILTETYKQEARKPLPALKEVIDLDNY